MRLTEAQAEDAAGERRQLTVLFCDLIGSTRLAEALDPEELGELLAAYQAICSDAVARHDGYVSQYLGDGVVVYFGYPRSSEDEPHRAVRCGLDILEGVAALDASRRARAGDGSAAEHVAVAVRLGAHTGRVVVGPVGAGDRHDRLALGSAPNIAARLQGAAAAGTMVISDATWRIVRGWFAATPLGRRELAGVAEPVGIWQITGRADPGDRLGAAERHAPFVGRHDELASLERIWKDDSAGPTRCVLVRGEAGVGKSRLARRFVETATPRTLLELRSTAYGTKSPFRPIVDLLVRQFGLDPVGDPAEQRQRLAAELADLGLAGAEPVALIGAVLSLSGDPPTDPGLSPGRRRVRTLELLVDLALALAFPGPTLLLVEDIHWADDSTLEFLTALLSSAARSPLTVLVTTRPEGDLDPGAGWLRRIELGALGRADAALLAHSVADGAELPPALLDRILTHSDGVPLFVEELTCAVLDAGALQKLAVGHPDPDRLAELMIPASIDASLMSRIDGLGASRATAQLAATIGREFDLGLLREVSDRDAATLDVDIARMLSSGLIAPRPEDDTVFEFRHQLVCDAAYNSLLRSTRRGCHLRIAEALRRDPYGTLRPDLIARHLSGAGDYAGAVEFWELAGRSAGAQWAFAEAASHFTAAIDCLSQLPASAERDTREMELQIQLAPMWMSVRGWAAAEVEVACARGLALATSLGRPDRCYPPMWGLWTVHWMRGDLDTALGDAQALLAVATASGMPMLAITSRHAVAYTLFTRGRYAEAIVLIDEALTWFDAELEVALTAALGLSSTVTVRGARGFSRWMLGRLDSADQDFVECVELAHQLDHAPTLATALASALYAEAFDWCYDGDAVRLGAMADDLVKLSERDGFFLWYGMACTFREIAALERGTSGADERMLEQLRVREASGARLTLVMMNVFCAEALRRSGRVAQAAQRLTIAEAEAAERGEAPMVPEIARVRARIAAAAGYPDAAEGLLRSALASARAQDAVVLELRAALDLHDLLAPLGRAAEALAPLAEALHRLPEGRERPAPARAAALLTAAGHTT